MSLTIREQILQAVVYQLTKLEAGVGADPYDIAWGKVLRRPIKDQDKGKGNVLSVLDVGEKKRQLTQQTEPVLQVVLEWQCSCPQGVEPATHNNAVLGELQRFLMDPDNLVGEQGEDWVLRAEETGNQLDVDSYTLSTVRVEGTLFMEFQYRHSQRDPRQHV